jgi:hypothetical protein
MEISLEKIELVKDRTGVSYKEAKEALEQTEGNVVDAIILIEEAINEPEAEKKPSKVDQLVADVKEAVKKGNVSKITVKKEGEVVLSLPVNVGIIGTVLFPWAMLTAAVAALGTKCSIELLKDSGEVVDVSRKASDAFETAKAKGSVVYDEMKDKGSEIFEAAKEKGAKAADFAKEQGAKAAGFAREQGAKAADFAKEQGAKAADFAKDKSSDLMEYAKDKVSDMRSKEESEEEESAGFDFSDLDLSAMADDLEEEKKEE